MTELERMNESQRRLLAAAFRALHGLEEKDPEYKPDVIEPPDEFEDDIDWDLWVGRYQ